MRSDKKFVGKLVEFDIQPKHEHVVELTDALFQLDSLVDLVEKVVNIGRRVQKLLGASWGYMSQLTGAGLEHDFSRTLRSVNALTDGARFVDVVRGVVVGQGWKIFHVNLGGFHHRAGSRNFVNQLRMRFAHLEFQWNSCLGSRRPVSVGITVVALFRCLSTLTSDPSQSWGRICVVAVMD